MTIERKLVHLVELTPQELLLVRKCLRREFDLNQDGSDVLTIDELAMLRQVMIRLAHENS